MIIGEFLILKIRDSKIYVVRNGQECLYSSTYFLNQFFSLKIVNNEIIIEIIKSTSKIKKFSNTITNCSVVPDKITEQMKKTTLDNLELYRDN